MIEAPKVFYAAVARDMLGVDPVDAVNETGRSSLVDGKPANRRAI
jgi:hypothetical protein